MHSPQTARTSRPAIKSLSKVAFPSTDVNGGDSPRLYVRWMFLVQPPSFFNRIPGGNWNGSGQKGNLRPLGQRRPVQTAINQSINSAIMVRNKLILQFFTACTPSLQSSSDLLDPLPYLEHRGSAPWGAGVEFPTLTLAPSITAVDLRGGTNPRVTRLATFDDCRQRRRVTSSSWFAVVISTFWASAR